MCTFKLKNGVTNLSGLQQRVVLKHGPVRTGEHLQPCHQLD